MHLKKRRKLFVLYSIPINLLVSKFNLCKRKYLVSYSIPLSCMVVLLLGLGLMVNPGLFLVDKSSAVTIQDEWVVKESESFKHSNSADNTSSTPPSEDETADIMTLENWWDDTGNLPMPACGGGVTEPTIMIALGDTNQTVQSVQGGDTVYGAYRMNIGGCYIRDYTLSMNADSVNLTPPSDASASTSTVGGANGKTGSAMLPNTWGYNLTSHDTADSSYSELNYANLPTTPTTLASDSISGDLALSKKLVFAAKFAENAAPGTYTGHITLSVIATEITQLWSNGVDSGIRNMQDISAGFCKNNAKIAEGDTIVLQDSRDDEKYTIVKLNGNCWMAENLSLTGPITLDGATTDLASTSDSWLLPDSTANSWSSDNTVAQIRTGSSDMSKWKEGYGNYYSWPAATAQSSIVNNEAVSSICSRKWRLPPQTGNSSYKELSESYKSGWQCNQTINGVSGLCGFRFGYNNSNISATNYWANFWPAAGRIYPASNAGLSDAGSNGYYWTRAISGAENATYLDFRSDGRVAPQDTYPRSRGFSVRCVADY